MNSVDEKVVLPMEVVGDPVRVLLRRVVEFVDTFKCETSVRPHPILEAMRDLLLALGELEALGYSREELLSMTTPVREVTRRSPFFKEMCDWDHGGPGNHFAISYIMEGMNHCPPGTAEHVLEAYGLRSAAAQQHRNKVRAQAEQICKVASEPERLVFVLACGPAHDLASVKHSLHPSSRVVINDLDEAALQIAQIKLQDVPWKLEVRKGSFVRCIRPSERPDLVVTGGLMDYVPDRLQVRFLRRTFAALAPGGTYLWTNITPDNPDRLGIEYLGNWVLLERDESDLRRLVRESDIPLDTLSLERDPTGAALIARVRKPGGA